MQNSFINYVKIFADLIIGIAAPAAFLIFIFVFRSGIEGLFKDLFNRAEKVSGFGIEATFGPELQRVAGDIQNLSRSAVISEPNQQNTERESFILSQARADELTELLSNFRVASEQPLDVLKDVLKQGRQRVEQLELKSEIDISPVTENINDPKDSDTDRKIKETAEQGIELIAEAVPIVLEAFARVVKLVQELITNLETNGSTNVSTETVTSTILYFKIIVLYAESVGAAKRRIERAVAIYAARQQ